MYRIFRHMQTEAKEKSDGFDSRKMSGVMTRSSAGDPRTGRTGYTACIKECRFMGRTQARRKRVSCGVPCKGMKRLLF